MDISELLLPRGESRTLMSLRGRLNALCGPKAGRRQISMAPAQRDPGSAEGTSSAHGGSVRTRLLGASAEVSEQCYDSQASC